jgi:hypothetical protein
MNKTDAFGYFGVTAANVRWSWSAADDRTVVLACWRDGFNRDPFSVNGQVVYTFGPLTPSRHPGFVDFIEHVQSAIASGGIVRAVIIHAKDTTATPREVEKCDVLKNYALKILDFDPETGALIAKRIPMMDQPSEAAA